MRFPRSLGNPHKGDEKDFLNEYSRLAVAMLVLVAAIILYASLNSSSTKGLPGIAFGWKFGLGIIRAAIVFGVVALVAMVLIRGWGGLWPQSVSTTGLTYGPKEVAMQLRVIELQNKLESEIGSIQSRLRSEREEVDRNG
jgi:hypothetical protein